MRLEASKDIRCQLEACAIKDIDPVQGANCEACASKDIDLGTSRMVSCEIPYRVHNNKMLESERGENWNKFIDDH